MATETPKQFDPKEAQRRWLKLWEEGGFAHSDPDRRTPFTIVIPPPNVTGALHMGHALNNTLQDILIRWRRMQGFNACWVPGTDHAGIATQAVVEKRIMAEEKKTRHDLGREELVKRIWQWKDQYEKRILDQLKQLGCSCDWRRTRFTLDETCSRAVRQTFFDFFKDGLIYRGKRLVNWDTHLQTAVADDELFHDTVKGHFWTFKYPVKSEPRGQASGPTEYIRFSTTRPETMLGDTAVAVHPKDERYRHLIGKRATIPLVGRDIPIIADGELVDPSLGTGAVKVTPAHDPNDYQCGLRHKLPMINILNPDGTINENGGKYAGLDRFEARKRVTADMEALGLLEKVEDRDIDLAHSDRSKTPIEPYLSDQWFVRMGDGPNGEPGLAQLAIDAVTSGKVKFHPERYAKTYLDWLGEKRDWCISRQLWWGHRIPVWRLRIDLDERNWGERFLGAGLDSLLEGNWGRKEDLAFRVTRLESGEVLRDPRREMQPPITGTYDFLVCLRRDDPMASQLLKAAGFTQDPDVLDTWFSSALWPHAVFGWPEKTRDLDYYYPTSVLVTSRDIITLWVARMVMSGLHNCGAVPFHHVYITTKLLDGFGETMSKTKGNGVDPLDIIERYGCDALRYHIAYLSTETQDSKMPVGNVCPHCDALIPVKQEHMYMRTRKVTCPNCKKPFRPGGPWPSEDPELPTAKQASEVFEVGRNFANKLWNAARFVLMNLDGYSPRAVHPAQLPIEDSWILSRLASTAAAVTDHLENYRFSDVARTIYDFTWSEFCDWYVEMAKSRLAIATPTSPEAEEVISASPTSSLGRGGGGVGRSTAQRVLVGVLDSILRLLHPIMPFVTESIWQALAEVAFERGLPTPQPATASVMIAPWPELPPEYRQPDIEKRIGRMQELIRAIRNIRNQFMVNEKAAVDVSVRCEAAIARDFEALSAFIVPLAKVGTLICGPDAVKPPQSATAVHAEFAAYVSLAGLIDVAAEIQRLQKQRSDKERQLAGVRAKLANPGFVDRAPAEVVAQQRSFAVELERQIQAIEENILQLQG